MADDTAIRAAIRKKMGWSKQSLSNRVTHVINDDHLMSRSHALYVLANQNGVPLQSYGVDDATLIEVGSLSRSIAAGSSNSVVPAPLAARADTRTASTVSTPPPVTRPQRFAARAFHHRIVRSSRKAFNSGLGHDAVRRAFQSVNNRVKKLSHFSGKDGMDMMSKVFRPPPNQALQMTDLVVREELDEHNGLRFMMQGAMLGIRNTRSHPDEWEPDEDDTAVLELLGFASWLHRCLDRCEAYAESA